MVILTNEAEARAWQEVLSRLLAAVINEKLVEVKHYENILVLCRHSKQASEEESLSIPLNRSPLIYHPFIYVDPLDIDFSNDELESYERTMNLLLDWIDGSELRDKLVNGVQNQLFIFKNLPKLPKLKEMKEIDYERCIIVGHATHPLHRTRFPLNELDRQTFTPEQQCDVGFHVWIVAIQREHLQIHGAYKEIMASLLPTCIDLDSNEVALFIHPMQWQRLSYVAPELLKYCRLVSKQGPRVLARASFRTLHCIDFPEWDMKTALALHTTSAMRTVSSQAVMNGPILSQWLMKMMEYLHENDHGCLSVQYEEASVGFQSLSHQINKHLGVILRRNGMLNKLPIIAAALIEKHPDYDIPLVHLLFPNMDKTKLLYRYAKCLFDAYLPPLLLFGFAFEAHGQNTQIIYELDDSSNGVTFQIIARDLGGIQMCPGITQRASESLLNCPMPTLCPMFIESFLQENYEALVDHLFHTLIQQQIHRMVRCLNGDWGVVRRAFEECLMEGHYPMDRVEIVKARWLAPTVPYKAFVSMLLQNVYRDALYVQVPNILLQ